MHRPGRTWKKWALAVGLGGFLALGSVALASASAPRIQRQGTLYSLNCGADRIYRFDSAWRMETLWTRDRDGTWSRVALPDPTELDRLRRLFLIRVGRSTLKDVPAEGQEELARLRSLGYI